jgi:hypothetical protein
LRTSEFRSPARRAVQSLRLFDLRPLGMSIAGIEGGMEHRHSSDQQLCWRSPAGTSESIATNSSCRSVVIVQHAAKALALPHSKGVSQVLRLGINQTICQTLVIALGMIVSNKALNSRSQRLLSKQNHPLQAGFLDGPYESFSICIQVRSPGRQLD